MKKFITIVCAVMLIACMAFPAHAVTPTFTIPNMPEIPTVQVDIDIPESVFDNWFEDHPIVIPVSTEWQEIGLFRNWRVVRNNGR